MYNYILHIQGNETLRSLPSQSCHGHRRAFARHSNLRSLFARAGQRKTLRRIGLPSS